MQYHVQFQYKAGSDSRPDDHGQVEVIEYKEGETPLIPLPGDGVSCTLRSNHKGEPVREAFKVLTRYFSYVDHRCIVNIVVTDMSSVERNAMISE